jgi:hypothetical protein
LFTVIDDYIHISRGYETERQMMMASPETILPPEGVVEFKRKKEKKEAKEDC